MAENIIDSLFIRIGVDAEEMKAGLKKAGEAFENLRTQVQDQGKHVDRLATEYSKKGLLMGQASDQVASRIMEIGTAGQKAALVTGKAMDALSKKMGGIASMIGGLAAPILAAFGGASIAKSFIAEGDALGKLSERLGVSAQKIDAWAKANEDAGGSQQAFKSALENFVLTTGRGEQEFFRMGEHIKGLTQRQAEYFLQTQGLSYESAAVFLKYRDAAEQAADAFNDVAMTDEQVKIAAEFNTQWLRFTNQAQSLGGILATMVLPVINKVMKAISSGVKFLNDHSRAVKLVFTGIGLIVGGAMLQSFLKGIQASSLFINVLKGGIPVAKAFSMAISANPLGALIAAVVAACLVLDDFISFFEGGGSLIEDFMQWCGLTAQEVDNIRQNIISFAKAVANLPETIASGLKDLWDDFTKIGKAISNALSLDSFFESVKGGFNFLSGLVKSAFTGIWDGLKSGFVFIDKVTKAVSGIPDAFVKGFDNGIKYVCDSVFSLFIDPLKSAFGGVFGDASKKAAEFWQGFKGGVGDLFNGIVDSLSRNLESAKALFNRAWDGFKETVSGLWDGFRSGVSDAGRFLLDTLTRPIQIIKDLIASLFDVIGVVKKKLGGVVDKVKGWFSFGGKEEEKTPEPPKKKAEEVYDYGEYNSDLDSVEIDTRKPWERFYLSDYDKKPEPVKPEPLKYDRNGMVVQNSWGGDEENNVFNYGGSETSLSYDQRKTVNEGDVINNSSSVTNVNQAPPQQTEPPRRKTRLEQYGERRGQFDWLYEALKVMDEADQRREAMQKANGNIAASNASKNAGTQVNNDLKVTVETHVQTDSDPQAVGQAVGSRVTNAMNRTKDWIANASTGVVQKG